MPSVHVYLKDEIYRKIMDMPPGERSKLINKLLKEYFARKKKEEGE